LKKPECLELHWILDATCISFFFAHPGSLGTGLSRSATPLRDAQESSRI